MLGSRAMSANVGEIERRLRSLEQRVKGPGSSLRPITRPTIWECHCFGVEPRHRFRGDGSMTMAPRRPSRALSAATTCGASGSTRGRPRCAHAAKRQQA
jgi:hypothetical protein